jgi:recombination protein RecR
MSKLLPPSIEALVQELSRLPGVGERTALRYSVSLMKAGPNRMVNLKKALEGVQSEVDTCPACFFWSQAGHCPLCVDEHRKSQQLCVVRDCPDVLALEKFRRHPWCYHVLQGLLSPLSGVGPGQIRIDELMHRIEQENITEIILALDATLEGDATGHYIRDQIKARFGDKVNVTRTALGLPAGSSVEYTDPSTLENALAHRTAIE